MPSSEDYEAIARVLRICRDGRFYEDYDESWEMLGKAEDALDRLMVR